jgi:hypothetical protein
MRIWILLLHPIQVMRNCDHWSTYPPGLILSLHAPIVNVHGHSRLHFEPLNFDLFADPDPTFYSNADPDPDSKNNADPDPEPQRWFY